MNEFSNFAGKLNPVWVRYHQWYYCSTIGMDSCFYRVYSIDNVMFILSSFIFCNAETGTLFNSGEINNVSDDHLYWNDKYQEKNCSLGGVECPPIQGETYIKSSVELLRLLPLIISLDLSLNFTCERSLLTVDFLSITNKDFYMSISRLEGRLFPCFFFAICLINGRLKLYLMPCSIILLFWA